MRSTGTSWQTFATGDSDLCFKASICFRAPRRWKTSSCPCFTCGSGSTARASAKPGPEGASRKPAWIARRPACPTLRLSGGQQAAVQLPARSPTSRRLADEPTGNGQPHQASKPWASSRSSTTRASLVGKFTNWMWRITPSVWSSCAMCVGDSLVENRLNAETKLRKLHQNEAVKMAN